MTESRAMRAVILDLDGTLLDTLVDIADSANAVLASLNHPTYSNDSYRQFVGEGVRVLFERALPEDARNSETIEKCAARFREEYSVRWNAYTKPYDGIPELLAELTKRYVKLAVLSNKPDEFTKRCVSQYFPTISFLAVLGQRNEMAKKPAPDAAIWIASQSGLPPEQFVFLGDTSVDMRTAISAGMLPVGVTWGFRASEELLAAGAKKLIRHPLEFLPLFDDF